MSQNKSCAIRGSGGSLHQAAPLSEAFSIPLFLCQEKSQTPTPQNCCVSDLCMHPKFLGLHLAFQAPRKVGFVSAVTKKQFCDFSQLVSLCFVEKQSICNFPPNPWWFWMGRFLQKSRKMCNPTLNPWLEHNPKLLLPSGILSSSQNQFSSFPSPSFSCLLTFQYSKLIHFLFSLTKSHNSAVAVLFSCLKRPRTSFAPVRGPCRNIGGQKSKTKSFARHS